MEHGCCWRKPLKTLGYRPPSAYRFGIKETENDMRCTIVLEFDGNATAVRRVELMRFHRADCAPSGDVGLSLSNYAEIRATFAAGRL